MVYAVRPTTLRTFKTSFAKRLAYNLCVTLLKLEIERSVSRELGVSARNLFTLLGVVFRASSYLLDDVVIFVFCKVGVFEPIVSFYVQLIVLFIPLLQIVNLFLFLWAPPTKKKKKGQMLPRSSLLILWILAKFSVLNSQILPVPPRTPHFYGLVAKWISQFQN